MVLIITLVLSLIVMATAIMTMTIKIKTSIAIMRIVGLTRPQAATILIVLFGSLFLCGMIV
jgi:hypothetical protein